MSTLFMVLVGSRDLHYDLPFPYDNAVWWRFPNHNDRHPIEPLCNDVWAMTSRSASYRIMGSAPIWIQVPEVRMVRGDNRIPSHTRLPTQTDCLPP